MTLRSEPLPYERDGAIYFQPFASEPWAVFLDSARGAGRYDIIAANPCKTLLTHGGETEIQSDHSVSHSTADPFLLLRKALGPVRPDNTPWPFSGGAIGYFGYDLARRIERLPELNKPASPFADMAFGIYPWCVIVDHQQEQAVLLAQAEWVDENQWRDLKQQFASIDRKAVQAQAFKVEGRITGQPDESGYGEAFERIARYILEGDCYQINFARCFRAPVTGDPWGGYLELRRSAPAPYGVYFKAPQGELLSNSPERFLTLRAGRVTTSPIKGTRPRGASARQDEQLKQALLASEKDRAENLMIVDLLRNDLGRSCAIGSIRVEALFRLESFATVHHLVSDISGRLAEDKDALDLMRNSFPGGSITGAPKVRAMEIIDELEQTRRGPYCGSMAYIGFNGQMDSNILIRTLMHHHGEVEFWAGGGIVADSIAADEFQETEQKASAIKAMLTRGR